MKARGHAMSSEGEALRVEYRRLRARYRRLASRKPYKNDEKMQQAIADLTKFQQEHTWAR